MRRGRETAVKKEVETERERSGGGPGQDATSVGAQRAIFTRGVGFCESGSATERNCTGWGTLIYWVITDLGARRTRGVWAPSPAPWSFETLQNGGEEYY